MAAGREATCPCKGYPKGAKPTAITPNFSFRPPQAGSHICAELVKVSRESKLSDFMNTVKRAGRVFLKSGFGVMVAAGEACRHHHPIFFF